MIRPSVRHAGFSLVEILLVILIILMLAGALVIYVLPQQEGAQRNTTRLKLDQVNNALSLYKVNLGTYPTEDEGGLEALVRRPEFEDERRRDQWAGPYLERGATLDDAWGRPLQYEVVDKEFLDNADGPDFRLYSLGPDGQAETEDDIALFATGDDGSALDPDQALGDNG